MNTTTWKNRALSVVLTVIMVFSMLPLSVFAAGGAVAEVTIGGTTTQYTDIDAAFAAAQEADSATVKLLADVTISHTDDTYGIQLKKGDITLEQNGKTISQQSGIARNKFYPGSAVFYLSVPGGSTTEEVMASLKANVRLTVQDSVGGGKIVQPNGGPAIVATGNGTLTVNSGVIENTSSDDFDDGRFHNTPNCAVLLSGSGKAVINGGTLSGMRGVAVAGYITKEEEQLYKDHLGIEGYNNDTYGNELTVAGGEISGTSGNALIVYDKAKKIELSGGTFSSNDTHSIWVADSTPEGEDPIKGDAASLLKDGCRYENNGAECAYSAEGNGVVGNATVALRPANEIAYIGADGKLTARADCTEITAETDDISHGWYVLKEDVTVSLLNISEEVHLILCDGATLTVSSYFNVGQDSTLNLYWQSAGSGKLTAKAIGMMGSVTAPAGGMKQTADATGTTFEKCFEHDWEYTNNGDTHTATCKLCGKAEAAESHKYESWTSTDADTHTGTCVCGATSTENHTLTLAPNEDGLTHSTKCSVCDYATAAEDHDFSSTDEFGGKKCACGARLAAEYNGKSYATLASAIEAAKDGGTVMMLADVGENITIENGTNITIDLNGKKWAVDGNKESASTLTVTGGDVTVQNGTLTSGFSSKAAIAVVVEGGKLTAGVGMTIQGGSMDKNKQFPAIEVAKSGELTLSGGAELVFGMKVSVEGKQLKDYLPEGTAFTVNGTAINGYVTEYSSRETLVVKEHSHSYDEDGKCACGFECTHSGTIGTDGKCTVCGGQMMAQDGNGKYYANLDAAFVGVADNDTVTMLTDDQLAFPLFVLDNENKEWSGKSVKLVMDGKKLFRNTNTPALVVASGKLTIEDKATISHNCEDESPEAAVSVLGGTLELKQPATITGGLKVWSFTDGNGKKHIGTLEGGLPVGTIITKTGTTGNYFSVSVEGSENYTQVRELLPECYAFAVYTEGMDMEHPTIIDGSVKQLTQDVIVVKHESHTFGTDGKCACGAVCTHTGGTASYFQRAKCATCGAEYGELLTDSTKPTGRITVTERNWFETFLNTISFNLFFKETVIATITAKDDSYDHEGYTDEKAVKVEYLVTDTGLDEAALENESLVLYDAGKGIDLTGEQNYVVYAKLTDWAGNETLLSTDGLVIDMTAPSIGDFTDGQEVHICSGQYTVSVEDANLKEVTVDGVKQTGNSVTFKMAEFNNTHTVVAEDKAGNTSTVTFTLHGGHNYNIETGVCENGCGAAAEVRVTDATGTRVWGKYDDALIEVMRSNTPVTVTLLKDCGDKGGHPTQYSKDGLDLTIDLNGHNFGNALDQLCVLSQTADGSAKLNLIGEGSFKTEVWLSRGATLTVGEDVTYVGGIKIWYDASYGDKVTDVSVALKGGKFGEIDLTYRNTSGTEQSVGTLGDLLVPGYVFKTDVAGLSTASDVEVEACPDHIWNNGACERCKLVCTHNWVGSTCTLCGYECLHSSVEERDGNTYCAEKCGAQMAAMVEYIDVNGTQQTKYYAQSFEIFRGEVTDTDSTLKDLFNNDTVTPDGSTVTLLVDRLQAWAHIKGGKTVTLNLNGKTLIETGNGICAYNDNPNNKLIVTGTGHSVENASVSFGRTFAVNGGTLEFASDFDGKFNEIYASGGTLTFAEGQSAEINVLSIAGDVTITPLKSGKLGKIVTEGSVTRTASSLLARGYAFRKADGSYVPYHTEITATSALENVTVVWCDHGMTEVPEGNQNCNLKCPDCGKPLNAVLKTADGKINGYEELTSYPDRISALSVAVNTPGCTVTMYNNAYSVGIWSSNAGFTLDANDCTIGQLTLNGGTLTVKNATITGSELNGGYSVKTFYGSTVATLTLEDCLIEKQEEGFEATLSANGPVTLKNTTVEGTTKVHSDKEQGLTVEGNSVLVGDTEVNGNLTFKSGYAGKITVYGAAEISGGSIYELDATDAGSLTTSDGDLTVSGGTFGKITAPDGKKLIDCLKNGYAFYNDGGDNGVVDGRNSTLEGVKVKEHTHGDYNWDPATHEKVCACGHATETDTTAPTFSGIADGETYYQNTLTFTATDTGSGLASVKDGGKALIRNASGEYTVTADNKVHTITATDNAGNTATVTVTVYKVYKVTLPSGTGYTVTGPDTVNHGEEYVFNVRLDDGYSRVPGRYKVLVNGEKIEPGLGDETYDQFQIDSVTGNLIITVEGVADITAPEAEITIGTNKFKSFLNTISFGLFFKETQTVDVTANDLGSGVDKAEYLLSETALGRDYLPDDGWTQIDFADGNGSFAINPNSIGSVYVRVTDKSGNIAVINSDGVVIYTDSTADTESITFTRLSDENASFNVNLNGNMVDALNITGPNHNDTKISGDMYMAGSDGSVTLENAFLKTLAAGEYTIRVTYRPMGVPYNEETAVGDAPASTTVKLTVLKTERTLTFSAPTATYDGAAYDNLTITDKPDGTTIQYKKQDSDDSTYGTAAPKNAGSYTVKVTVAEDENYNAATFTKNFTISPKEVTINGVTADNKTYDGNDEATITGTATLSDNYDGENLTVKMGKANFADKNVGTGKTVTFSGFELTGSAKDNYKLTAQPASVTADITAKEVTVSGTAVKSTKVYNGSTAAEIESIGNLDGVEDGDNLTIVKGKAAYADKNVGTGKTVTFSEFALDGADKDNYTLKSQPASVTADITAKEVTVSGTAVKSTKVYNGSTAAEIESIGNLIGVENGDDLTVVKGKAAYDTKNVGTGKTVTFSEFALDGADKDNYTLKSQPASVTADITAKEVIITGTAVKSTKVYNGSTAAEIESIGNLDGVEDGDNLTIVKGKAAYADKNVGTGKTVTFSGFALGGAAAGNYELAAQPESVTANIVPKDLTVENLKVKDKVYDGNDKAELDGTPALKGVEDGDEVQLDCGTPTFTAIDVGENIAINFTLFFLSGTDSGNYTLTQPTGITGNIAAWLADGSEYRVNSNDWINTDFTVTAKTGYQLSLADTANGTWTDTLSASNETADGKLTFYVKNTATGAISAAVTEHYKIDKTAPTGTVKLDERTPFEEFLHKITFGLFFKDDVTVKLTASDEVSGVKSKEYYKSDKALTLEEVKALTDSDWTADDSLGITAEDMAQFVIYARITDNAGNITYLSSDGAEFDTTAPEIIGVENGKTYYVTRRVAFDDANLKSVTVNGESVDKDTPFDLAGDKNAVYTIVATDEAGNVTEYTVTMKPISDITDAIKDITEENVKSGDADAIDAVTQQILDIAAGSDEEVIGEEQWNKLTEAAANCKKLQTRMAYVAAESERLTDEVTSCEIDKVTSADIANIEPLITDIDTLLGGSNLTDTERAALEALKQTAQALLDRIADAKDAAESDEILAVEDITKDNVTLDDKEALEKAEKALEKALDDFDGNYTDDERESLNDRLDTVKAALDAIGNAEKAAEEIKKLPSADDVKLSDKDEIERISKIIDALTDNEKALIGEDTLGKLKALNEKLTELADNAKKPTSPSTGDTSNLALWIALLFISGGVITGATIAGKKKKQQGR